MRSIIRIASLFIGMAIVLSAIALWLNRNVLIDKAVAQLEEKTGADLHFTNASLQFFPPAAVALDNFEIRDNNGSSWLSAGQLEMRMDLGELLRGEYVVRLIKLKDAQLQLLTDANGQSNNPFVKSNPETEAEKNPTKLQIEKGVIRNMEVNIRNIKSAYYHDILIREGSFKLNPTDSSLFAELAVDLTNKMLRSGKDQFESDIPVKIAGTLEYLPAASRFRLLQSDLRLSEVGLMASGILNTGTQAPEFDFVLSSKNTEIASLLSIFPESWRNKWSDFKPGATCDLELELARHGGPTTMHLKTDCVKGKLANVFKGEDLHIERLSASWSNTARGGRVSIDELSGQFDGEDIRGSGLIYDLKDPRADFSLAGTINPLKIGLTADSSFLFGTGKLEISKIEGEAISIRTPDWRNVRVLAKPSGLSLIYRGQTYETDGGELKWEDGSLQWNNVRFAGEGSKGMSSGRLDFTAGKPFDLHLEGEKVNLASVISLFNEPPPEAKSIPASMETSAPTLSPNFEKGHLQFDFARVYHDQKEIEAASGSISIDESHIHFQGNGMQQGGIVEIRGTWGIKDAALKTKIRVKGLSIGKSFAQWDDFGQQTITSDHLQGQLDGYFLLEWKESATGWDPEQLLLLGSFEISEGRIENFPLLQQFSSYIHAEDLREVRFPRLQNLIKIERGIIYLPSMFIRSNAANFTVSGQHTFDNEIRYNIKLNAGQILSEKLKKHDPSLKPVPAKNNGFFNLYYTLFGPIESFAFETDKTGVKSHFRQCEQIREEIRSKLLSAFGEMALFEEPEEWQDIPEYDKAIEGEMEYLEEF